MFDMLLKMRFRCQRGYHDVTIYERTSKIANKFLHADMIETINTMIESYCAIEFCTLMLAMKGQSSFAT